MKLFTEAAEYALRAAVWLADHPGQAWTVRQIADGTQSKAGYLIRVIHALARADIVSSQGGVGGGVVLKANPRSTSILDVLNAVDPMARIKTCPLGLKTHGKDLCALHLRVDQSMAMIEEEFSKTTLADLLSDKNPSKPLCDLRRGAARS